MARVLAEATMVVHLAYLAFVVFGGFLAWRWPRALVAHLVAVGAGVLVFVASLACPLTYVEDRLRRDAGQRGLPRGFVDTYLEGVLYPVQYAARVQLLAAGLIVVSWVGAYVSWRRHAPRRVIS